MISKKNRLMRSPMGMLVGLNPEVLRFNSELGETLGRERMFFNIELAVENFLRQSDEMRQGDQQRDRLG